MARLWIFGNSREVELTIGADLSVLVANRAAAKLWGIRLEQFPGMNFSDCFTNPEAARDLCATALDKGAALDHILEVKSPTGEFMYLQCSGRRDDEDATRMLFSAQNITDRKSMPSTLFESQEIFRNAFENANIGIGLVDFQGKLFDVNRKLCELLNLTRGEVVGLNVMAVAAPGSETPDPDFLHRALADDAQACYEKCFVSSERESAQWVEISFSMGRAQDGKPICAIASFRDINDRKQLQAMLEEQASLDPLTKALTHACFEERANIELSRSGRHGHQLSLLLVDLDYFRVINDKFGSEAGDQVLCEFCAVARGCLRMTDLLGRWGGEEFSILLPDTPLSGAKRVAERIRSVVEKHAFSGEIRLTVSLGVTSCREKESLSSVLDRADDAIFNAKQGGRNQVVVDARDIKRESASKQEKAQFLQLHWKKTYASGNHSIDIEHKRIFHITNHILATMNPAIGGQELMPLLDDLLIELGLHFEHEEELLEEVVFAQLAEHREMHRKLLSQADRLVDRLKLGDGSVGEVVGFMIHEIVANHILKDDPEFFACIAHSAPADALVDALEKTEHSTPHVA